MQVYGATLDGATPGDDALQAAHDAAKAEGGGTIWISGDLFVAGKAVGNGLKAGLVVDSDNITVAGPGRIVGTAPNLCGVLAAGSAKVTDRATCMDWANHITDQALIAIEPAAKGDTTVTLSNPADAASFTVGDDVYLRTGQTIDNSATHQPDAELNQIVAINGAALTLARPLAKPYAQEWYKAGATGPTSTTPTADPAPFGICVVTDRIVRNLTVDVGFDLGTSTMACVYLAQVDGATVSDIDIDGFGVGAVEAIHARGVTVARNAIHRRAGGDWPAYHVTAPSTGCGGWTIEDNTITADAAVFFHAHEGVYRSILQRNTVTQAGDPAAEGRGVISIRARAYDMDVDGNHLDGSFPNGFTVIVDDCPDANSRIASTTETVAGGVNSIRVAGNSSGWTIEDNVMVGTVIDLSDGPNTWRRNTPSTLDA